MKKSLIIAAIAVAAVSCGPKVSDLTTVSVDFIGNVLEESSITVSGESLDTLITVPEGTQVFEFTVPTNTLDVYSIQTDYFSETFVADGTTVKFSLDENGAPLVESTKGSVNEAYVNLISALKEYTQEYYEYVSEAVANASDDESRTAAYNAAYETVIDGKYMPACRKAAKENKDNVVALVALSELDINTPEEIALVLSLDEKLKATEDGAKFTKLAEALDATAEGKMFTDFTIGEGENAKSLSDYVGKGKYILVDFWASWCRPCKNQIPYLKDVYNTYAGENFDVLSVAVWDDPQASVDTAKAYGVNWSHIIDAQRIPTDIYGIRGIPHIILFGPDGTILKRGLYGDTIKTGVEEALQ